MPFALVQHYAGGPVGTGDAQLTRYSSRSRRAASTRVSHQLRGRRPRSPLVLVRYNNIQLAETRRRLDRLGIEVGFGRRTPPAQALGHVSRCGRVAGSQLRTDGPNWQMSS